MSKTRIAFINMNSYNQLNENVICLSINTIAITMIILPCRIDSLYYLNDVCVYVPAQFSTELPTDHSIIEMSVRLCVWKTGEEFPDRV